MKSVLLHIPHASTHIPEKYRPIILLSDNELQQELIRLTDLYTDDLYALKDAARAVFPVSRFVVDPERFSDDTQEPMAARGMGVIYTVTTQMKPLRQTPSDDIRQELLSLYYTPHHRALNQWADFSLKNYGQGFVIDCHSFSSAALPYEMAPPHQTRPHICLGTDAFHTPDSLVEYALKLFQKAGYATAINSPFSGALVPADHYQKNRSIVSLMIEVRKDLYMDEETGEKNDRFVFLRRDLSQILNQLAQYVQK